MITSFHSALCSLLILLLFVRPHLDAVARRISTRRVMARSTSGVLRAPTTSAKAIGLRSKTCTIVSIARWSSAGRVAGDMTARRSFLSLVLKRGVFFFLAIYLTRARLWSCLSLSIDFTSVCRNPALRGKKHESEELQATLPRQSSKKNLNSTRDCKPCSS
jgi:hypothetical protein